MFRKDNFQLDDRVLKVNKKDYQLSRLINIKAKKLQFRDQLIRFLALSFGLSVVGLAVLPIFGFFLMILGAVIAVATSKKYELRAEFRATDESGDQWIPIARGRKPEEYEVFQEIAQLVLSSKNAGFKAC